MFKMFWIRGISQEDRYLKKDKFISLSRWGDSLALLCIKFWFMDGLFLYFRKKTLNIS